MFLKKLSRKNILCTASLTLLVSAILLLNISNVAYSLNLGGQNTGYAIVLDKGWTLLTKEQQNEIAKVLVAPYDPDGSAKLISNVQAAVSMGSEQKDFKQITIMPIPYSNIPVTEKERKKLSLLDHTALFSQKEEAVKGIESSGVKVLRSGIMSNGYWVLGSVNNTILQEMRMYYTKKGALMALFFAGGTDKKAEEKISTLSKKLLINPSNQISVKKKH